ncbi:MAG: carbohydrate ABC transporter permease [Firmicutes bacterium]|nr:carbohydrate ABC transporter permease [Bacillota bacterium]
MSRRRSFLSTHVFLVTLGALTLYPMFFMVVNAMRTGVATATSPFGLPSYFHWMNFVYAWDGIASAFALTGWIELVSVVVTLAAAILASYAFARMQFQAKNLLFTIMFALLVIPGFLTLIPLFLEIRDFDLLNTSWGLILPYIAGGQAFAIFVLRSFIETIPEEMFEAARIDGANHWRMFLNFVLPLAVPMLITLALLQIVGIYGDYVFPSLVLNSTQHTVSLAIANFTPPAMAPDINAVNIQLAAFTLSAVPIAILFFALMKYFVNGMSSGALKM